MVRRIEAAVIQWLDSVGDFRLRQGFRAGRLCRMRDGAEAKIAALGLKVRNGCTYHGLAVNIAMDLAPFADIDPCGYPGLAVTQLVRIRRHAHGGKRGRGTGADTGRTLEPTMTIETPPPPPPTTPPASSTRVRRRPREFPSRSSRRNGCRNPNGSAFARRRARASTRSRRSCARTACTPCARKRRARTSASASARAPRRS